MDRNRETVLDVLGMSCRSCVGHVNGVLRELDGVCGVDVRLSEREVVVRHDPTEASIQSLVEALAEAGYDAQPKRTA